MTSEYFALAVAQLREQHPQQVREALPCEQCERSAWKMSDEVQDGRHVRTYCCSAGHLKVTDISCQEPVTEIPT